LGFGASGSVFGVQGSGCRRLGSGYRVEGLGGLGFSSLAPLPMKPLRVERLGFGVHPCDCRPQHELTLNAKRESLNPTPYTLLTQWLRV